jgi:lysophospholipase L1-like esterase
VKALTAQRPDVLFIGDSITQAWSGEGKDVWRERFAPLNAANIGSSGDRTQHALWRIVNGEFACKPKAAVVMIGTNNQFYDPAEDIIEGVTAVIDAIRQQSPGTKVLLMSILPRGNKLPNERNDKSIAVNRAIARLADRKSVWFIDIYDKYLEDGQLRKGLFIDDTHLSAKGYRVWADAITPRLKDFVGRK